MQLSAQEQLMFSQIMFSSQGRQQQQIAKLKDDQIYKLRRIYSQKIAFDAVNSHIKPPNENVHANIEAPTIPGIASTLCCCFYPEENRDNFDINSIEFMGRICRVFAIWRKDFIEQDIAKTELYGPLWITVTYIIILGLAANLNEYFIQPKNYEFDNNFMVYAVGISLIFQIAEPLLYSAVLRCLGGSIPSNQSVMITGYSLMLYIIPTVFCLIPSFYFHLMMLIIAALLRTVFLFRNYSSRLDSKIYIILAVTVILEGIYVLIILKVIFPNDNGYSIQSGTRKVFHSYSLRRYNHFALPSDYI